MTKKANPNSTKGINVKSRTQEEEIILRDFKSLANHLNVDISNLFFEQSIKTLKSYNWPNSPQTSLAAFKEGTVQIHKCKCGADASVFASQLALKQDYYFCKECLSRVPMRYDAKLWKIRRLF